MNCKKQKETNNITRKKNVTMIGWYFSTTNCHHNHQRHWHAFPTVQTDHSKISSKQEETLTIR